MRYFLFPFIFLLLSLFGCKSMKWEVIDYRSIPSINPDSTVNMIVEIPSGTTAKYEMNKLSYRLEMDSIDNQPRFIDYLGYPGNYGMIPNTMLSKTQGGDGDPIDVLLLGTAKERGTVQKVRVIGALQLLDNGEKDDKLIAIDPNSKWSKVLTLNDLDIYYPGSKTVISTFFENYKGKGQMQIKGWLEKSESLRILEASKASSINR